MDSRSRLVRGAAFSCSSHSSILFWCLLDEERFLCNNLPALF